LSSQPYIGRFAPSPTGDLHFGSLVTAVASYLEAQHHQGQWHLRIDDLDEQRCIPGKDKELIESLETFGFQWNGPIVYQSKTLPHYRAALEHLKEKELVYACDCSRKTIEKIAIKGVEGPIYPESCTTKNLSLDDKLAIRVKTLDTPQAFFDKRFGLQSQNVKKEIGTMSFIARMDTLHTSLLLSWMIILLESRMLYAVPIYSTQPYVKLVCSKCLGIHNSTTSMCP
jgi:glutamyl-Q tRNA(Asp) synthetase